MAALHFIQKSASPEIYYSRNSVCFHKACELDQWTLGGKNFAYRSTISVCSDFQGFFKTSQLRYSLANLACK